MAELYYGIKDKEEILKRLIEVNLIYQFLRNQGVDILDNKVDEVVEEIARMNNKTVEELAKELRRYSLTLKDFKEFLKKDLIATSGLREYLMRKISVSEVELELAKLKSGKIKVKKEVELLVIPKEKGEELLGLIGKKDLNLKNLSETLKGDYHILTVEKGDLVKELDELVWKAKKGEFIFAEDKDHIYVAKVLRTITEVEGVDEEELRRKILSQKFKKEYNELLKKLVKNSVITIVEQ
ncbi:MAG TPA: peptidylprolyl isomerase [Aquificaceae bacterium]|nr:peptidylprolyl isomerase [Aquificaceae bacterium]HIQ48924.1 peptidylprolyl isomerase [Aquifex aeolicus]